MSLVLKCHIKDVTGCFVMTSPGVAEAKPFEGLDIERTLLSFQRPVPRLMAVKKPPTRARGPRCCSHTTRCVLRALLLVVGTGFPTATRSGGLGMIAGSRGLSNGCEPHEAALSG